MPTQKAIKTYSQTQLATRAKLAGDSTQDFHANSLMAKKAVINGALQVQGLLGNSAVRNYHYLNQNSVGHYNEDSGNSISIRAQNRVAAIEFMAYSDHRIKKDFSPTDNREDLDRLTQLELTNYHYIDVVGHGSEQQKKLIAQQVEKVYPQAITRHENFIPSIYRSSVSTAYDKETHHLKIVLDVAHDLDIQNEIRLITDEGQKDYHIEKVIDAYSFVVISELPQTEVFVFGKKVHDFAHIDYTAISMLGISATQQLSKENHQLREETARLKQLLQTCLARLDKLELE